LRPALSVAVGLRVADDAIVGGTAAAGCAYQPIGVAPLPFAAPLAPSGLADAAADIASGWAEALPPPLENWAGTAAYRRRMSSVLARRLIITAGAGA